MANTKKMMCRTARLLYQRNLASGKDGNISMRIDENSMLITPSGVNKGFLKPRDLLIMTFDGDVLSGSAKPTRESQMHAMIYRQRNDINAVVHSHPAHATAFAAKGMVLPQDALIEVKHVIGKMALVPTAEPGSEELAETVANAAKESDNIFLQRHGVITCGKTLFDAFNMMEAIENAAKTIILSELL